MVTRALRLFVIGLAAAAVPLAVSACELLAGVHGVTLEGVGAGEADGGGDAGADGADGAVEAATPQCGAYSGPTYHVDPVLGDDATGTGSPDCEFQTITAAVQHLGAHPPAGTVVMVADQAQITGPPEMFPIGVPENVVIKARSTATVSAPTGVGPDASVFSLSAPDSGLENLIIDGSQLVGGERVAGTMPTGIVVDLGSDETTTYLENVQVEYMGAQGILVTAAGKVTLKSGVSSASNGLPRMPSSGCNAPAPGNGLVVYGRATIHVDSGDTTAVFEHNANIGIWVRDSGSLTVMGTADNIVRAESNWHGLVINQTPNAGPQNDIASLLVVGSLSNGIEVTAGSSLVMRGSASVGSIHGNGILVAAPGCGTMSNDVSQIDLGSSDAGPGGNTFQSSIKPNSNSGICLALDAMAHQRLLARGNNFRGFMCATMSAGLTQVPGKCASGTDYGVASTTPTTNSIDLTQCN